MAWTLENTLEEISRLKLRSRDLLHLAEMIKSDTALTGVTPTNKNPIERIANNFSKALLFETSILKLSQHEQQIKNKLITKEKKIKEAIVLHAISQQKKLQAEKVLLIEMLVQVQLAKRRAEKKQNSSNYNIYLATYAFFMPSAIVGAFSNIPVLNIFLTPIKEVLALAGYWFWKRGIEQDDSFTFAEKQEAKLQLEKLKNVNKQSSYTGLFASSAFIATFILTFIFPPAAVVTGIVATGAYFASDALWTAGVARELIHERKHTKRDASWNARVNARWANLAYAGLGTACVASALLGLSLAAAGLVFPPLFILAGIPIGISVACGVVALISLGLSKVFWGQADKIQKKEEEQKLITKDLSGKKPTVGSELVFSKKSKFTISKEWPYERLQETKSSLQEEPHKHTRLKKTKNLESEPTETTPLLSQYKTKEIPSDMDMNNSGKSKKPPKKKN